MQYNDEKKEKLNKLENKLYSRNAPDIINASRSDMSSAEEDADSFDKEPYAEKESIKNSRFDELASKMSNMAQKKNKFVKKIFIFSILFFVIASGVAAFMFLGGVNMVSSKNVDIKLVGPVSVGSGQEVSFDINIINNNNVALESSSLLVEYPAGTRSASDLSKDLTQERFELDTIRPGRNYSQNIKAVFFGEKGSSKEMKISLEYRVENSSALFYKEKSVEISISSAPIIITPTYPKEVNSNQDIQFNIEAVSNSKDRISDFLLKVDYPFGFVFKEASPAPTFGNNIWRFVEFDQGDKRNVTIRGSIIGQDNEERVFNITAGTPNPNDERAIAIPFAELTESILVSRPFLNLDVFIEGKNDDFVAQGGNQATVEFVLRNNLPERLYNSSVEVAFSGGAFSGQSVSAGSGGFFQSFNNTILWDKRAKPELAEIGPGQEEDFSFRLSPLPYENIAKGSKPEVEMVITARGERILESGSVEKVSATETRKITLGTDLSLSARTVRSLGNIENSGPMPPKANQPTTYTVRWSIVNSVNQVSNVEVRATVPSYVKWTGIKSPQSELFIFNEASHEVVWNVGSVLPNTKKEFYFQLEFLPSTSQIGQTTALLEGISLYGLDKVTGVKIEKRVPSVTTNFSGDPSYRQGDERVVQ